MFAYALATLARLLLALLALLGHTAHTAPTGPAPAPVHHVATATPAPRHPAPWGTAQAMRAVLAVVAAHHGHVASTGVWGYGPQGQHTAQNGGVWAQVGPGQCVGYQTYGRTGGTPWFGNVYGFTGGDCS